MRSSEPLLAHISAAHVPAETGMPQQQLEKNGCLILKKWKTREQSIHTHLNRVEALHTHVRWYASMSRCLGMQVCDHTHTLLTAQTGARFSFTACSLHWSASLSNEAFTREMTHKHYSSKSNWPWVDKYFFPSHQLYIHFLSTATGWVDLINWRLIDSSSVV